MPDKLYFHSKDLFPVIEELLDDGLQASFTVSGTSMWPLLCHNRDQVILEKCDIKKLKKDDVVLYMIPSGEYILHRITGINETQFETAGDNGATRDGWFDLSYIKAKAVGFIRKGKHIDCTDIRWRILFWLWRAFPVRRAAFPIFDGIIHVKHWLLNYK